MIKIDLLNIFLSVAETKNFSQSAAINHVSQSTISKRIKALEKDLHVKLFERDAGGVRLTEAGKTLLPWAKKLVLDSVSLQNMMESIDDKLTGQLKIACSTTAGKYILPQLAARFCSKNPDVRISILPCTEPNLAYNLLGEEADLGVASREFVECDLECQYFFTDYIGMIVPSSHPWVSRESIDPEELFSEPFLIRESTSGTRRILQSELAKHDISLDNLNIFLEIGNAEAIVTAVSAGIGVSFVSRLSSAYARVWGCVVEVPVNNLSLQRKICIGRKIIGSPNRVMESFWNFIHEPENEDILQLPEL